MDAAPHNQMNSSLAAIHNALAPGHIGVRRREILALTKRGDTGVLKGAIGWRVELEQTDKAMSGTSESLHSAFGEMARCLDLLAAEHGEDADVSFLIKDKDDEEIC